MKSINILKVINNFKKVLPMATKRNHLNMMQTYVQRKDVYECGTIHCHGGWYAVAACDLRKDLMFEDGSKKMARDLGLRAIKSEDAVPIWAIKNPQLWGNYEGVHMFNNAMAFFHPEKRPYGAQNLQDIIDHWQEVYERVKTKELLKHPPVNDLINSALKQPKLQEA